VVNPRVHVTKQDGKLEEFVSQPKYCVTKTYCAFVLHHESTTIYQQLNRFLKRRKKYILNNTTLEWNLLS